MDWAQVLVIILSVFLAIFLLLAIVLVAMLIKVTHQIKMVATSAQHVAQEFEKAAAGASRMVSPMILVRTIMKLTKRKKRR